MALHYIFHRYYEHGNKCVRMLAQALLKCHTFSSYPLLLDTWYSIHSKIASLFRNYYAALYKLNINATPTEGAQKQRRIASYFSFSGFPNLSSKQQPDLELPISPAELWATVRSLPNGKSQIVSQKLTT